MQTQTFIFKLLVMAIAVPFWASAETVSSENFVLTDNFGNMRGQMTYSSEGTPSVFLYDTHNVPRVWIGLYPDGAPGVVLNDDKGLAGALMRLVSSGGDPVLVLKEAGQDKVIIDTHGRASPVSPGSADGGSNIMVTIMLSGLVGLVAGAIGGGAIAKLARPAQVPPSQPLQ